MSHKQDFVIAKFDLTLNEWEDPSEISKLKVHVNLKATSIISILLVDEHDSTPKFIISIKQQDFTEDSHIGAHIGILNIVSLHSINDKLEFTT